MFGPRNLLACLLYTMNFSDMHIQMNDYKRERQRRANEYLSRAFLVNFASEMVCKRHGCYLAKRRFIAKTVDILIFFPTLFLGVPSTFQCRDTYNHRQFISSIRDSLVHVTQELRTTRSVQFVLTLLRREICISGYPKKRHKPRYLIVLPYKLCHVVLSFIGKKLYYSHN